jgi:hypothetical protein
MMAAFNHHGSLRFWLCKEVSGESAEDDGMSQFGNLTSVNDVRSDKQLKKYLREAIPLSETSVKLTRPKAASRPSLICLTTWPRDAVRKSISPRARLGSVSVRVRNVNTSTGSAERKPTGLAGSPSPPRWNA